ADGRFLSTTNCPHILLAETQTVWVNRAHWSIEINADRGAVCVGDREIGRAILVKVTAGDSPRAKPDQLADQRSKAPVALAESDLQSAAGDSYVQVPISIEVDWHYVVCSAGRVKNDLRLEGPVPIAKQN